MADKAHNLINNIVSQFKNITPSVLPSSTNQPTFYAKRTIMPALTKEESAKRWADLSGKVKFKPAVMGHEDNIKMAKQIRDTAHIQRDEPIRKHIPPLSGRTHHIPRPNRPPPTPEQIAKFKERAKFRDKK
jgi:hypothetical protein